MKRQNWTVIGFIEAFIFPALAFMLIILGFASSSGPIFAAIEAIYSLGLIAILLFAPIFWGSKVDYPGSFIAFCKGARYGMSSVAVLSVPIFVIVAFLLHQTAIAAGFAAVGIGAIWFPSVLAAGAYARVIGDETSVKSFVGSDGTKIYTHEKIVVFFLALFLGDLGSAKKFSEIGVYLLISAGLYSFGWVVLNTLGAYPTTILGIAFIFITPLAGYLLFRASTSNDSRRALRTTLENYRR